MIYVSSDWHGVHFDKIKVLLDKAKFSDDDFLFVLGDVIDRGKYGVGLLKYLMCAPNIQLLRGNHEDMMLSCDFLFEEVTEQSISALNPYKMKLLDTWKSNGAEPTIEALRRETPEMRADILEFVRDLPVYDFVSAGGKDFLLVHGGLGNYEEGKKIEDYEENELVWTRPTLSTQYSNKFITVLGHTPTCAYSRIYENRIIKTNTWFDIDTGAAFGYNPMLLCLDNGKEYYLENDGSVTEI